MNDLIEHHIKYEEIHGVDETVWMTRSDHKKLHNRLRREEKCNIPAKELRKIATIAYNRTSKSKAAQAAYKQTPKAKAAKAEYNRSPKGKAVNTAYSRTPKRKASRAAYAKKNHQSLEFSESPCPYVQFREHIVYNHNTGTVSYTAQFRGGSGHKLPVVDIE